MTTATLQDAATDARQRAEEAQRKATAAQAVADRATEQARQEATERLRRDAERCLATFDRDRAAGEQRVVQARDAFNQQATTAESFTELRDRYLAWSAAATDHYFLHRSLANACGRLGKSTYQDRAIPSASEHLQPPSFSAALDTAIARVVQQRNADIEDAAVQRILDLENGVE